MSTNNINIPLCKDFFESKVSYEQNFLNLLYSLDENLDTNLVNRKINNFTFRLIYNIENGHSYIIRFHEKDSTGLLKIKEFETGEMNFFNYCVKGQLEYTNKNKMLTNEKVVEIKKELEDLKNLFHFKKNNFKISNISIEIFENGEYNYGTLKGDSKNVKQLIDLLIQ